MSDITVEMWLQNSAACMKSGDLGQAEKYCRQVLDVDPVNPQALHRLGVIAMRAGQFDLALQLISRAAQVAPRFAVCYSDLGEVYLAVGNFDAAISCWQKALGIDPNQAAARANLDNFIAVAAQSPNAEEIFRRLLMVYPNFSAARNAWGEWLVRHGQFEQAIALWRSHSQQNPNDPDGDVHAAIALARADRSGEALEILDAVLGRHPDHLDAHVNRGMALFQTGKLAEAFKELDWYSRMRSRPKRKAFAQPRWDGTALAGRTLMLMADQGLGDAIQLVRFVPGALAKAGEGKVALARKLELARLFKTIKGLYVLSSDGALPRFDLQCPLSYLPVILEATPETLSRKMPYLAPYRRDFEQCGAEISALPDLPPGDGNQGAPRKIGLCWAGGPAHPNDAFRSIPLAKMLPLLKLTGTRFFSFQKGEAQRQIAALAVEHPELKSGRFIDWTDRFNDLADAAALLAHMDLVITVDTAVAHLAGALGRRVWTLLPKGHLDWRWYPLGKSTAWYPTMRLFHQTTADNWDAVIERVVAAISRNLQHASNGSA